MLALIDHELRFLNSRRTMRGMLQTGAIGSVRHCNYVFRSDYRGFADRAWDWWSDATMGGGTLGAIGSHVIDSFRWMLEHRDHASARHAQLTSSNDRQSLRRHARSPPTTKQNCCFVSLMVH